jgi:predicted nucleic acid-binding protein
MTLAVDTSVLISIAKDEPVARDWIDRLISAQTNGELIICDVVAAEYFAALKSPHKFEETLTRLGIAFSPTTLEAAQLAGRLFKEYRQSGGPREHLIPDFLIGAHAQEQADGIAAIDRGYLRRYFPRLKVLQAV